MRGLTACFVIVSLALTNGVLSNQVYQIFNEDSYVYKICNEDRNGEKRCQIKEEDKYEGNPYKTCDLSYERYANTSLLSFGYKNVILSFTDGIDNKIVTVSLKDCSVKEVSLDIDIEKIRNIVFHDDKYYIFFYDTICKEFYCKAIYDSKGKIADGKGVTPLFGVYAASDISFKFAKKGLLMNEFRLDGRVLLYFIPLEDFLNPDNRLMFAVPHGNWFGISTLDNKLGFCAFDDGKTAVDSSKKIVCQQYDAEGKTKLMESEIQIKKENHVESLKVSNYDNKLFVMVNEWQRTSDGAVEHTFLVRIDEQGKQGERFEIDVKCEKDEELDQNFHKRSEGIYVLFYTCYNPFDPSERDRGDKCLAEDCYPHKVYTTPRARSYTLKTTKIIPKSDVHVIN